MAAMAKKKEEWLAKLRGITTSDQNIDTPSTLTSNSAATIVIPTNDATLTTSVPTATTQPPTDDATSITKEESKQDTGTNQQVTCVILSTNNNLISLGKIDKTDEQNDTATTISSVTQN
jgi:hypothetical protein